MQRIHVALATVTVLLAACGGSGSSSSSPSPVPSPLAPIIINPGQPIIIGVSAQLEGAQAQLGTDLADAVDLAIADFGQPIAGHSVQSRRENDGCNDPEQANEAAAALSSDEQVIAIVGPICTTGAQAANDVYENAGIVHITPSVTRQDLSSLGAIFFFRTVWHDDAQAQVQSRYMLETLASQTAIVIDDGDPYGRTLADAFIPAFEAGGGRVLSRERIRRGDADFTLLARQIVSSDPDAVVFEGLNPEGALLIQDLRERDYDGEFVGPDSLLNTQSFIVAAGPAAEGAVITAGPLPDELFTARFVERFGRAPSTAFVLQAYDATRIILEALAAHGSEGAGGTLRIDRERLSEAVRSLGWDGLTGSVLFDGSGDRKGGTPRDLGLAIFRVQGSVFQQVE